ncbi:unnamed protein product [Angiostrongylus costaricensis]|uniref:DUF3453 domain-containing protein n=1 Tax=Angiostrongylus costaricensis TaxID=334426 RepID=A0A158PHN7_ANGCS|nr:unnamed protein product [Angiostrongylus costaricensis]
MVTDLILPALPKVKSREPAVLMAILGVYKLTADCESVVVSREQWAKSALPFLIPICVENTLNLGQFEQFIAFVKSVIGIVERDQRLRLQQLSAMQEQQIDATSLDEVMKPDSTITNTDLANLKDIHGIDSIGSCLPVNLEKELPLSEKGIRASKQERNHGLQSQASIQPVLSPVEYSKLPTMAVKPNDGFTLVGESTVQPFHQQLDMYICPQKFGVVPALNNLDLSVFESGGSTWAECSAVDEHLRNNCASEGSTNAAIQRTNKFTKPLTSLDSLLSFSSNSHEIARIEENNKSLNSAVHHDGSKALDPFMDLFM